MITYVLAAAVDSPPDSIFSAILGGGGVMGAVFLMVSFGWGLHSNDAFNSVKGERDRALQQVATLTALMSGQVVPALAKQTDVVQANTLKEDALVDRLTALVTLIENSKGNSNG